MYPNKIDDLISALRADGLPGDYVVTATVTRSEEDTRTTARMSTGRRHMELMDVLPTAASDLVIMANIVDRIQQAVTDSGDFSWPLCPLHQSHELRVVRDVRGLGWRCPMSQHALAELGKLLS